MKVTKLQGHIPGKELRGAINIPVKKKKAKLNYHSIFDQASDAIYVNDFEGNFIDANECFCQMFGYTKKEFEQLKITDLIEQEQLRERPLNFDRVARGEHVFSERRMVKKNGDVLEMEINVRKFGADLILVIARDVTEMRKAQKMIALSEANYHSIFNQASDAIYICDIAGRFLDVNESFCLMFGYTAKEFQELTILDVMEPEELKERPIAFALVATGAHLFGQRRMIKKNGDVLDMEINLKMYEKNRVLAIARDVTELRNTQKMIQVSEERFRSAFEHSAIGMALVSLKGEWLKVNKELYNIVGYSENELLGLTFQQITYPDDLGKDLQAMQQALDGVIESYRMEKRYIHKNGSLVWIHLTVSAVKDGNSKPLYFVAQIENITERKEAELQKEKMANDLINRHKDLEQFAHILSHNVRSHIARLIGLTNLLMEHDLSEAEKNGIISDVSQSSHGLDEVVRDLNNILQIKK